MNERYIERDCPHGHDWWDIKAVAAEEQRCSLCGTIRFVGNRSRCMIFANER